MQEPSRHESAKGVALVITLLVLMALAFITTAFMQSMSIERRTSRAYLTMLQAENAARAGLEKAKTLLAAKTANDYFIVLRVPDPNGVPYYFIGTPTDTTTGTAEPKAEYAPLFTFQNAPSAPSPALVPLEGMPPIPTFADPASGLPRVPASILPAGVPSVSTSWETIDTGAFATPKIRYCFWIEDLGGYLDADVAGNLDGPDVGGGPTHKREFGQDPKEVALFTVFNPTQPADQGDSPAALIIRNRQLLLTSDTLNPLLSTATPAPAAEIVAKNLIAGTRDDLEQNVIPFGFGYKDAGKPKYEINSLIGDGVDAIAKVIDDNLPKFNTAQRKGDFAPDQDYVKTLAASMIDYADADNDATAGGDYRGVDSYPFLTAFFYRFEWKQVNGEPYYKRDGTWHGKVELYYCIQLWNPSDKDINLGVYEIDDSNNHYSLYAAGSEETPCQPLPPEAPPLKITFSPSNPLRANEHKAFEFGPIIYECDTGVDIAYDMPTSPIMLSASGVGPGQLHSNGFYLCRWNGVTVDRPGSGSERIVLNAATLDKEGIGSGPTWRGSYPAVRYDPSVENTFNVGDPRAAFYINRAIAATDYEKNGSWWGRIYNYNLRDNVDGGATVNWMGAQSIPSLWPDGGHDTAPGVSVYALGSGSGVTASRARTSKLPSAIPLEDRPAYEPSKAVMHISNAGSYERITELGNIFDPAQWRPDWTSKDPNDSQRPASEATMRVDWQNLERIDMLPDGRYGIASTLRIGRPEFKTFDKNGLRSSQLLDLFTISPTSHTRGRVNLNTASHDILRALLAGIKLDSDSDIVPAGLKANLYAPKSGAHAPEADLFADAVIAARPFISTAQLSGLMTVGATGNEAYFGNARQWPSSNQPKEWNDREREELFARAYDLASVRSRNFRIYVAGQALDRQGKVAGGSYKVYTVFVRPHRNQTGEIDPAQNATVEIAYESNL